MCRVTTLSHCWATIRERAYTHDISCGENPASTGGRHIVQIRRARDGNAIYRVVQANGQHTYCSPSRSEAEAVAAMWIRAEGETR
jgi:hypothetical protein